MSELTFIAHLVLHFIPLTLELLHRVEYIQASSIASGSGFQIHDNVLHLRGIVPKLERVDDGVNGYGPILAQVARRQPNFLCRIECKGDLLNQEICPNRVARMFGIQMLILKDGATSWRTDRWPKVATGRDILSPV